MSSLSGSASSSSTGHLHLADIVVTAAQNRRKINKQSSNIDKLRLSNMKLHGREENIKLLRGKLRELAKKNEEYVAGNNVGEMMKSITRKSSTLRLPDDASLCKPNPNKNADNESKNNNNSLILVSGTSGTGKSALIQKGLGDHASKLGYTFTSGKFDDKLRCPLSAFSDAMTCLVRSIMVEHDKKEKLPSGAGELSAATLIRYKIQNEFDEEDVEQLQRVLPGCTGLLALSDADAAVSPLRRAPGSKVRGSKQRETLVLAGEESISRMHYAIRRLLRVICSHLKGVVLFIDDLQWSDTATLDLLKSIVSDGEIPSLLIVGAYREDEVPE